MGWAWCQERRWIMSFRWKLLLEKEHGLEMGRKMH